MLPAVTSELQWIFRVLCGVALIGLPLIALTGMMAKAGWVLP